MSNEVEQFIKENPGSSEVENKRNLNSKFFEHFGKMTMHAHLTHLHWFSKQTHKLEDVDCQFIPCDYGWEMRKNNYELEIPAKANSWFKFINSFGYDSRGKEQVDRPDEIVAIKPLGVSAVSGKSITKPEWKGKGIVLYKNAYGPDIDLEVMARNTGFVKEVVINKKPADLSKDLEFAFEIDLGDKQVKPKKADYMKLRDTKIKAFKGLEGKELLDKQKLYEDNLERDVWNKTSKLETSESIILEKLRKTWFRKFNLFDSEGNQGLIKVRLENIDGKIILTKVLDKRFLENAVYPVRTDTTTSYYAGAGDGDIFKNESGAQPSQTTWDTAHDALTGTTANYTAVYFYNIGIRLLGNSDETIIRRGFIPCDTSGLPDTAIISEAILKIYGLDPSDDYNGDGYDYLAVVQTDQPNSAELTTADYNNCGATNNPDKGSADIDISGISTGAYNDFTLNATGRGWIQKTGTTMLGLREGHDIQDNFPGDPGGSVGKSSCCGGWSSEETDTDKDPYLSITYTISSSSSSSFSSSSSCSSSFSSSSSCSSSFSSSSSCSSSFSSSSSSFSSSSSCSSSFSSSSSCSSSFSSSSSCSSSFSSCSSSFSSSSSCSSSFSSSSSCSSSFSSSSSSFSSSSSCSSSFSSSSSCSSSFSSSCSSSHSNSSSSSSSSSSSCSSSFSSCSSSFSSSSSCSSSFSSCSSSNSNSSSSSCSSSFSSSSSCSSSFSSSCSSSFSLSCSSSFSSSSSCSSSFSSSSSSFSSSSSCSSSFSSSSSCSSSFSSSSSCSSSFSSSSSCSSSFSSSSSSFSSSSSCSSSFSSSSSCSSSFSSSSSCSSSFSSCSSSFSSSSSYSSSFSSSSSCSSSFSSSSSCSSSFSSSSSCSSSFSSSCSSSSCSSCSSSFSSSCSSSFSSSSSCSSSFSSSCSSSFSSSSSCSSSFSSSSSCSSSFSSSCSSCSSSSSSSSSCSSSSSTTTGDFIREFPLDWS